MQGHAKKKSKRTYHFRPYSAEVLRNILHHLERMLTKLATETCLLVTLHSIYEEHY